MTKIKILSLLLASIFLIPGQVLCNEINSIVEQKFPGGIINWSQGYIQAKGTRNPPEKNHDKSLENQAIIKTASLAAIKRLFEVAKQVRIYDDVLVGNIATENSPVMTQIEEMTRKAAIVKQEFLSDGTVEITIQMSLYGGFSQLILPRDLKQLETVKQAPAKTSPQSVSETIPQTGPNAADDILTGLVVDTRGLKIQPSLYVTIYDENHQEVYGSAFASREFAVQRGMVGFMKEVQTAATNPRVGKNPLIVKGLRINHKGLVISNADASRLKGAVEHLTFLKECRVLVVMD